MHSAREDMDDGEKIGGKFGLRAVNSVVENQDFSTVELDHVLKQLKSKSAESIATGNNKRELIAAHKSFQYGLQSFSFEIESRADVFDDFSSWEEGVHIGDLPIEVVSLLGTGDSTITEFVFFCWFFGLEKAVNVKESLTCCISNRSNCSIVCVLPQGVGV